MKYIICLCLFIVGCNSNTGCNVGAWGTPKVGKYPLPKNFWAKVDQEIDYVDIVREPTIIFGLRERPELAGGCMPDGQVQVLENMPWWMDKEYVKLHELSHSYWYWMRSHEPKRFNAFRNQVECEAFPGRVIKITHGERDDLVSRFLER